MTLEALKDSVMPAIPAHFNPPLQCTQWLLKVISKDIDQTGRIIMQTCPYNEDPHTPHFYIGKLEFTGVYIIF